MARPRRPVPTLQEAVQAQPQAAPTGGSGVTAAPLHLPIYDFAPLSETVSGFLADKARKDGAKAALEGERFVLENPALVADLETDMGQIKDPKERAAKLKEAFAFLQRAGKVVPAGDPFWQVGYARAAGRMLAGSYRDRLSARITEVSTVRGPDGQAAAAPDLDAIMSEEWQRVQDSPAVQNFYGGQEALGLKAQVDEEFRSRASLARAQAQEQDYTNMLTGEIGGRFDAILAQNPVVTSETLQSITDFLSEEVRGHNVMDPRGLTMQALELSIRRLSALDGDEAVRAVHAAQDLVVGGVRLGDDRGPVGLRLQELTRQVRDDARQKDQSDLQQEDAKRRLAIQEGESEYVPLLVKAKADGQSPAEVARKLTEKYLSDPGAFGGRGAFVVDAMNDFAKRLDGARESDAKVLDQFNILLADGNLGAAEALVQSALNTDALTGEDYARAQATLSQRREVSPFVEQSGLYQAVRGRYQAAKPSGFSPEVQQSMDDQAMDLERRLERDFSAFVRTTAGKPNREELHRAWLDERESADLKTIRALGTETRSKRDEAVAAIRQGMTRFQDSGEAIDQAERTGAISVLEAQGLREQNAEAVSQRARFFQSDAYRQADADIDRQFDLETGGAPASADDIVARTTAHEVLRDAYDVELSKTLADPSVSPATFDAAARTTLRRVKDELGDRLFPSNRKTIKAGIEGGKSASEAVASAQAADADLSASEQWQAQFSDPAARERFTADSPFIVKHPAVPAGVYQDAAAWMSDLDPIFGSPTTRAQVEHSSSRALVSILADLSLTDADRQGAVGNVLELVGGVMPGDVIQGRVVVEPPDAEKGEAMRRIAHLESLLAVGQADFTERRMRAEIESLRPIANAAPTTVDMKGYAWRPYTTPFFRTREAMAAYQTDPAYPDFLRALGLDPEDDRQVRAWRKAQLSAIARINP